MSNAATTADKIITPEISTELRTIGAGITTAKDVLKAYDLDSEKQHHTLEALRLEVRGLEVPSTLPDDATVQRLIFARAKAELLTNFLNGSPARRGGLVANLNRNMQRLGARLREITTRTHPRFFENPNILVTQRADFAVAELERVITGIPDEFEKINQSSAPLIF